MSGPIREQRQKCHYGSSIGVESRTGTVVESKKRLTSKRNFVLDSTTFLNFRVPDSTKSSEKLACARGGGFDENKLEKKSHRKNAGPSKKFGYRVLGLRKPNFKTKNIHFEKSLGFLNFHSVAKYQKNEGGPFGNIKKFPK